MSELTSTLEISELKLDNARLAAENEIARTLRDALAVLEDRVTELEAGLWTATAENGTQGSL